MFTIHNGDLRVVAFMYSDINLISILPKIKTRNDIFNDSFALYKFRTPSDLLPSFFVLFVYFGASCFVDSVIELFS